MKYAIKWALCLSVCLVFVAFGLQPAFGSDPWGEKPPKNGGKPSDPPHESVAPTYYGQPAALDDSPWVDPPRRRNKPDPVIPTISPLAWWMEMAMDEYPWIYDPPRKNSPKE